MNGVEIALAGYLAFGQLIPQGQQEIVKHAEFKSLSPDLVVNATPVGLKPDDPSVLPAEVFRKGQLVLDIIPTKKFPPTATAARLAGATAVDGLEFLVGQGAKSFEIWTGLHADRAAMLASIRR